MKVDNIEVSGTAAKKRSRYLTAAQPKPVLPEQTGYACTKSSPNHDSLNPDNKFILPGQFTHTQLEPRFLL